MSRGLIIVGVGEFAEIAYEYFTYDSDYEVVAFAVDSQYLPPERVRHGLPILELKATQAAFPASTYDAFVAVPATRMNRDRREVCERVESMGYRLATYVSSRAFVWRNVTIGKNCFVFEGNTLQPFTQVGDRCVLWSGNHIGHRTVVESDVFITSHVVVSGYCHIGSGSFLGVNSTLNDHVRVGEHCLIGATAHVNRDTEPGLVYVGAPARPIPGRSSFDVKL